MKFLKSIFPYLVILLIVILIRSFLITPIKVNGQSMYDTLDGDEIMLLFRVGEINRYDMVVADLIVDGHKDDTLIKRVYGLPGETIKCENGTIYINDRAIEDPYATNITSDFEAVTLGSDEYFLLGDNRSISLDSRIIGPIHRKDIEGHTNFVIWPFSKFGTVEKET